MHRLSLLILTLYLLTACAPAARPADTVQAPGQPDVPPIIVNADGETTPPQTGGLGGGLSSDESVVPTPPTPSSNSTATAAPTHTATATPAPTHTATPSPTPLPTASLRQLTTGSCCVTPFWRADSQAVRFIDRPTAALPVGYYEVPINPAAPVLIGDLVTETLGNWAANDRYYVVPNPDGVVILDNQNGETYNLATQTTRISFSPDGTQITWSMTQRDDSIPSDRRLTTIWLANIDGSDSRIILQERGLSFSGWADNDTWFLTVRDPAEPEERPFVRYRLSDGSRQELVRGARVGGISVSPDGQYMAYFVSLDRDDPERNGYWLTNIGTGETRRLPFVGAYRWRTATSLIVIPFEPGTPSYRVQEYDITTDTLQDLTTPAALSFRIHNNDWSLSPDGNHIVFVNSADRNLWLITLP